MQAEVGRLTKDVEAAAAQIHQLRESACKYTVVSGSGRRPRHEPFPAAAGDRARLRQQQAGCRRGPSAGGGGSMGWEAQPDEDEAMEADEVLLVGDSAEQCEPDEALAAEFAARARAGQRGRAVSGARATCIEPEYDEEVDVVGGSEDEEVEEAEGCEWDAEEEARLLAAFQDTAVEVLPDLEACLGAGTAAPRQRGAAAKENQPPHQRRQLKRLYPGEDEEEGGSGSEPISEARDSRSRFGRQADDNDLACSPAADTGAREPRWPDEDLDSFGGSWGREVSGAGQARAGQLPGSRRAGSGQPRAGSRRQVSCTARSDSGSGLQVRATSSSLSICKEVGAS